MNNLFLKMKGGPPPPVPGWAEVVPAFVGSGAAMSLLSLLQGLLLGFNGLPLIVAPMAASAVLVFGACGSPLAQPRNVIGGHVLSGLVGVTVYQLVGDHQALAASLAVPLAIALMLRSGTLHPPGGATAFVTAAGGPDIHVLGYQYVLTPCLLGSVIMVLVGLVTNNLSRGRRYPHFW